jgi:predicted MFS family arabinose efflux permease
MVPPPPADPAGRGRRWSLAANLTATMAVGPFPVFAVGALAPLLTAEFGLSRTQLGILTPVAFSLAAIGAYLGGHLPDRLGPRRILIGLYVCAALSFLGFAGAWSFPALIAALAFSGIAMSLANPVTNAFIGRLLPAGERGGVMGLKQSGVPMGQFVAGATLPVGALLWNWRGVLLVTATLPLLGIVVSLRTLPRDPDVTPGDRRLPKGTVDPSVWVLSLYSFLTAMVLQATGVYIALYAFEEVAMGATVAGATVGVLGAIGIVARIAWGRAAERRPTVSGPLMLIAGVAAVATVGFLLAQQVGGWMLWLAAGVFGASAVAVNAVTMMATFRVAAAEATGRATGVIVLGMYSGFVAGPPVFGAAVDAAGAYAVGWAGAAAVCVAAVGVGGWLRLRGV